MTDSVESLYAAHGPDRGAIYWVFLTVCSVLILLLPLIHVDVSVGAPGIVRPKQERFVVRSNVDGNVKEVKVRENQVVKAGENLVLLESRQMQGAIDYNRLQQSDARNDIADLERASKTADSLALGVRAAEGSADQMREAAPVELRSPIYRRQYDALRSQLEASYVSETKIHQETVRLGELYVKGLIPRRDLDQARADEARVRGDRAQLLRQTTSGWQVERLEKQAKITELKNVERQLLEQQKLYSVTASTAGTVMGVGALTAGQFVPSGNKVCEISPSGPEMVEAFLLPKDIGFVRGGQRARVQIDAFPYAEWGTLDGTVTDVSADLVEVGQVGLFKVQVELQSSRLHSGEGATVRIHKGMTANVRFVVARRTLWQLLYQRTSAWLDPEAKNT